MKFISDFKEGETIVGHYFCKKKDTLKTRAGKNYFSLKLQDKTGVIEGKVWELNNDIQNFDEGDFIKIDGAILSYQNTLQANIRRVRKSLEGEFEPEDYMPATERDVNDLFADFTAFIGTIENAFIKQMLESIFVQNEQLAADFKKSSAAKTMHHCYMGGLLEHSLSVVQICDFLSTRYKHVNRDILIASAMLHDVGKIKELSAFPMNDYTDDGQLLGHIIIGVQLMSDEITKIDGFPDRLASMLKHCMLSHHGILEYGSPKVPQTIEAFILHCADDSDAKIKAFEDFIGTNEPNNGSWMGYHKMLQRNIRKTDVK